MTTEAEIKAFLNTSGIPLVSERDWRTSCQALMYQLCKRFGSAPVVYSSAAKARAASTIVGKNPALARPGDFHHFDLNVDDHISLSLGGSRGLMGSSHCPDNFATNCGTMTVEDYCKASGAIYLGFSRTDGANDLPIEVSVMAPNDRTVRADIRAIVRADTTTTAAQVRLLDINSTHPILGWKRGQAVTAHGITTDAWFKIAENQWSSAVGWTNPSTAGITDLNPAVPPSTGATRAEVEAIVKASEARQLAANAVSEDRIIKAVIDAFSKVPVPPTAAQIAQATIDLEAERLKS